MARSGERWRRQRQQQSYLDNVANHIFKRQKGWKKQEPITVIAFIGDGTFRHQRGHDPVPKKQLVKAMSTRGCTVVLDEFNTSKWCPCGKSELQNVQRADSDLSGEDTDTEIGVQQAPGVTRRNRCHMHTTDTDEPCSVCEILGEDNMDRDVLATINMLQCAHNELKGVSRPCHLCRKQSHIEFTI